MQCFIKEDDMRFRGKVAMVTGSTKGIGAQVARRFAAEGASVVVTGRSKEAGEGVADEIRASGGTAIFLAGDVSDPHAIARVVQGAVAEFGRLDVLINNAAPVENLTGECRLTDEPLEAFETMMRVGLFGAAYAAKAAIPEMLKGGSGAIVNISSIAGLQSVDGLPGYSCAKGALQSLTRQLAGQYGKEGIRSNCIIVGAIYHTDSIASAVIGHPRVRQALGEVLLTKNSEVGTPDDIAEAALFLASDGAWYINGVLLPVDGGLLCRSSLPDIARILEEASAETAEAGLTAVTGR
jgi:NAD(P)-dependent dehydrogenase (short-subunit alcohol dehydrogenase family)